jgi:hypothetical protein
MLADASLPRVAVKDSKEKQQKPMDATVITLADMLRASGIPDSAHSSDKRRVPKVS